MVGISGSIAAVESVRVIRELVRHGAEVRAVMSPEAARIVTPEAVEFATGHRPVLQLSGAVEHVSLLGPGEGRVDLYLIAPCTANTLSKIAHGIDDTSVTSCASVALGGGVPLLLAPAMHQHMHGNPAIRANLETLRSWGVRIIEPTAAEGEEKLATPEEIAAAVVRALAAGPWVGRSVIVIGGASREPIDRVRAVTNESSGATAVALAREAFYDGAEVELWLGGHTVVVPPFLTVTSWSTVTDLVRLIDQRRDRLARAAAVIVPAALSDFTIDAAPGKIASRGRSGLTLRLRPATKVLPKLRSAAPPPALVVGFKLLAGGASKSLLAASRKLLEEAGLDAVVANDVSAMGSTDAEVTLVRRSDERRIRGTKTAVATELLRSLAELLPSVPARPGPSGSPRRAPGPRVAPRRR